MPPARAAMHEPKRPNNVPGLLGRGATHGGRQVSGAAARREAQRWQAARRPASPRSRTGVRAGPATTVVLSLLAEAGPLEPGSREQARMAWIRESFADGTPGDASQVRSLAAIADRAGAGGDSDLALKLFYGAALRCWWGRDGDVAAEQRAADDLPACRGGSWRPSVMSALLLEVVIDGGAVLQGRVPGCLGWRG